MLYLDFQTLQSDLSVCYRLAGAWGMFLPRCKASYEYFPFYGFPIIDIGIGYTYITRVLQKFVKLAEGRFSVQSKHSILGSRNLGDRCLGTVFK